MQGYRTALWREFRLKVIQLDGGVCSHCGRGPGDGVVLHVHHKQYIAGHKPWEYPFEQCETLCAGCHAAEHGKIPPKTGWEFAGVDDLGDIVGACELCNTPIRYVFMVTNPAWRALEVGTECCDRLTSSGVASEFLDVKRRHSDKLKRFVSSTRWKVDSKGVHYIVQNRLEVRVFPYGERFRLMIEGVRGRQLFNDVFDAKKFVFDFIESGQAEAFMEKRREKWLRRLMENSQ